MVAGRARARKRVTNGRPGCHTFMMRPYSRIRYLPAGFLVAVRMPDEPCIRRDGTCAIVDNQQPIVCKCVH